MITKDDILVGATAYRKLHPQQRLGQSIFNYVDLNFGDMARHIQFSLGIDCFYNDNIIDKFVDTVVELYNKESK